MFEELTFEEVMERMLDRIDDIYDKRESSPIYAALAPAALEILNIYAALDDMMDESFADTASREYLVRIAASRGMTPRPAKKAVVLAEFTPDTVEIEDGAVFTSEAGTYEAAGKIADGKYKLEYSRTGEDGNMYLGEIIPADYIEGLETANIQKILVYGEEEEGTEEFRSRYLNSFKANEFGGNRSEYESRALQQTGVGAVKVFPVWNGAGTVKLVILDADLRKASAELLKHVQDVFDPDEDGCGNGLAPIGHIVTVDTVEEVPVKISADITYDTGYDWNACKVQVEAVVLEYFKTLWKDWSRQSNLVVRGSAISAAMMHVEGIIDIRNIKLNGSADNLILESSFLPVFGGVECE